MKTKLKIPNEWSIKKLGDCFSFLKTPSYSRNETTSVGDVHYIHYGDIHTKYPSHVCPSDINIYVSEEQAAKGTYLENGDLILLDASEDYEGTTKCIELINIENGDKIISGLHTFALRDNSNNFANGFRAYITSMPLIRKNFWKQVTGIKVYGVSKDNLKKLKLLLPPLSEQKKIAEILSCWDDGIEKLSALIDKKKLQKKALMQQLLTGKHRLKGFSKPWEEVKLGDVCFTFSGGTPLVGNQKFYNGNIPFIRSGEIHSDKTEIFISQEGLDNSSAKLVHKGDLLLALYGATSGEVDISKIDGAINQAILCIRSKKINLYFLNNVFQNEKNNILKKYLQGGQGNLSADIIKSLRIFLPSISEQQAIADVLSKADEEIELLNKKLEAFKEQKKGLMQQLLTGKIRVKVN